MKVQFMPQGDIPSTMPCKIHYINFCNVLSESAPSLSLNFHENVELLCCMQGEGTVMVQDQYYRLKKGNILFIHSEFLHQVISHDDTFELYCLIINDKFCQNIGINLKTLRFETEFTDSDCSELIVNVYHCYKKYSSADAVGAIKLAETFLKLFSLLTERYLITDGQCESFSSAENTVRESIKLIQSRFNEKLTLDMLSSELFVNKFYLCRIFKQYTGMSVINYINEFRLARAKYMIEKGKRISLVAWECGFSNPSYFTKTYKKHYGYAPLRDLQRSSNSTLVSTKEL